MLKLGNLEISDIKLGSSQINKVYAGSSLIWEFNVNFEFKSFTECFNYISTNTNYSTGFSPEVSSVSLIGGVPNEVPSSAVSRYSSGVLAPNGKIYCPPCGNLNVLVIDTNNGTLKTIATPQYPSPSGDNYYSRWGSGVLAKNGKIYCPPIANDKLGILEIDPTTDTCVEVCKNLPTYPVYTSRWQRGTLADNGKIYFISESIDLLLIFNPSTLTFTTTYISNRCSPMVQTKDGRIFLPPYYSSYMTIINTLNDTIDYVDLSNVCNNLNSTPYFACSFLDYTGSTITMGFGFGNRSYRYNISTKTASQLQFDSKISCNYSKPAIRGSSSFIIPASYSGYSSQSVLFYNVFSGSCTHYNSSVMGGIGEFSGYVTSFVDGSTYGVPYSSNNVVVLKSGSKASKKLVYNYMCYWG